MKTNIFNAVLIGAYFLSVLQSQSSIAGGIPVFDASNLAQAVQQVTHMVEQIKQLKAQLDVAQSQLDRISGSRGMGNILDSAYDPEVSVDTAEALKSVGIKSAEELGLEGKNADLYDAQNQNAALQLGQAQKSLQQSQARFAELAELVAKVNDCPDQKDILDLQARISAEQTLLENEKIKLAMLQDQAQAQEAMHKAQIRQKLIELRGDFGPIGEFY